MTPIVPDELARSLTVVCPSRYTVLASLFRTQTETRNGGLKMSSSDIRRVSAGLAVAFFLALVQAVFTQRAGEPAAPAGSGSIPRPAGAEAIVPFRIQVPDAVLTDLKQRLSQARFADEFPDAGWDYGTNLAYLKRMVDYWRDRYDWRAQERRLNEFDQFTTNIDGVAI